MGKGWLGINRASLLRKRVLLSNLHLSKLSRGAVGLWFCEFAKKTCTTFKSTPIKTFKRGGGVKVSRENLYFIEKKKRVILPYPSKLSGGAAGVWVSK